MAGEVEQDRVEADGVALSLQDRAFQIVVETHPRNPAPALKCLDMAGRKLSMRASRKKRRKIRRE